MQIYHVETQEDYDALMEELEREVYTKLKKSYRIASNAYGKELCVISEEKAAWFASRNYCTENYPDIPIIKYESNRNAPVNNPKHYTKGELEVIDILQDKLTSEEFEGFLKGNILKYTFREGIKNGTEDMKKGAWYMARLIEFRKGKGE